MTAIGPEQFQYDELNRLVHASVPVNGITYTLGFAYDPFGNMVSQSRFGSNDPSSPTTRSYTVDWQTNRLVSQVFDPPGADTILHYTFDGNGNMTSEESRGYVFDAQNRLLNVMDPEWGSLGGYDYDASNYRVRSVANDTETFYIRDAAGQVMSEFQRRSGETAAPAWNKDYVNVLGKSFALIKNQVPAAPKKPWATNIGPTGLRVNWEFVSEPDILGYSLERTVWTPQNTDPIAGVTNHGSTVQSYQHFFTTSDSETKVTYRVRAVDTAGNLSDPSPPLIVRPHSSRAAPPAPTGVTATAGDRSAVIRWTAVTSQDDIAGYIIERRNVAGGPFIQLNDQLLITTEYLDQGLNNGQLYSFAVRAVDTAGRVSAQSSVVSIMPSDATPPGKITDIWAEADRVSGVVRVGWERGLDADVSQYRVYRSTAAGIRGGQVASAVAVAETSSYVATDSSAAQGTDYFYSVTAVDTSSNESTASEQFLVRPRHGGMAIPVLQSAEFEVFPIGPPSSSGLIGSQRDWCDIDAEDDDVIQVKLVWTATSDATGGYRVYRRAPDEDRHLWVGSVTFVEGATQYTFNDTTVTKGDYTYFVAARGTIGGFVEESAASTPASSGADHAYRPFPTDAFVRNVRVDDARAYYATENRVSRQVTVSWSRVTEPELVGYNVYRMCSFDRCDDNWGSRTAEHFACEPVWIRLNTAPISPQTPWFEDASTGGLQGCYLYAVRPVGPNRVEGPIGKITAASLHALQPAGDPASHCKAVTEIAVDDNSDPTDYVSVGVVLDPPNGVNAQVRGTGSPAGPPAAPQSGSVTRQIDVKPASPLSNKTLPTEFAKVLWTMSSPEPSDLAGFHVEAAGSPLGPWKRLTVHPVAWWERHYTVQGVGVKKQDFSYSGHSSCLSFRVISVDEDGNESAPVVASTPLASACPTTPDPPTNLRAETFNTAPPSGECRVRLNWDAPTGSVNEAEYYVYRTSLLHAFTYFYQTQVVPAPATTFDQRGDSWGASTEEFWCPYAPYSSPPTCPVGWLDAYYVTARGSTGGESPRSNLVFWKCDAIPGYAKLEASDDEAFDALASTTPEVPAELLACWQAPEGQPVDEGIVTGFEVALDAAVPVAAVMPRTVTSKTRDDAAASLFLASAPMLRLGSLADPPWVLLDLHTDHLGTVRLVTDAIGAVVSRHDYLPFGEQLAPQFSFNTHQYTGHERDKESGLDYMSARYYGGGDARFVSADPLGGSPRAPQTWNRYSYVANNPIRLVDPTGHSMVDSNPTGSSGWWPSGPGGAVGWGQTPCVLCFQVTGGPGWQQEEVKKGLEAARLRLKPEVIEYYDSVYGIDLNEMYTDGKGPVVNLDEYTYGPNGKQVWGEYDPSSKELHLNMNYMFFGEEKRTLSQVDLEMTILHETEHFANDAASWIGNLDPGYDVRVAARIWREVGNDRYWDHAGPWGWLSVMMQFGTVRHP